MKCAACGAENRKGDELCYQCGHPLGKAGRVRRTPGQAAAYAAIWLVCIVAAVCVFWLIAYRVYFWITAWQSNTMYARGLALAPEVEQIEMEYGKPGHAITFFGEDGSQVFIKELRESYPFTGGVARIEIADSNWFDLSPEDVEAAEVTLTPIIHDENGGQKALPVINLTIETPHSPLTLVDPATEWYEVNTSYYPLSVQVVPGSTVLVAGEDVSDQVDYLGGLTVNVTVYPVGDNNISLLASTPNHCQTRTDIDLYRAQQDINLEPSLNLPKKSNRQNVTISGSVDPTATLSVDTAHVDGSIKVQPSGSFTFLAKMETVGDNTVTFRASKEGCKDSVISLTIYYVPNLNAYSRTAWKMDYEPLKAYYETWLGRVFLCDGKVVEILAADENEVTTVVMDVSSTETPQYVLLKNYSSVGTPEIGARYKAYADVSGQRFYDNTYCPELACRYMSLAA